MVSFCCCYRCRLSSTMTRGVWSWMSSDVNVFSSRASVPFLRRRFSPPRTSPRLHSFIGFTSVAAAQFDRDSIVGFCALAPLGAWCSRHWFLHCFVASAGSLPSGVCVISPPPLPCPALSPPRLINRRPPPTHVSLSSLSHLLPFPPPPLLPLTSLRLSSMLPLC